MWVLIWAALLLSLTERTTCLKKATAAAYNITFSPAEITPQTGLCAVIPCSFTHPDDFLASIAMWLKCPDAQCSIKVETDSIFHSRNSSIAQEGYRRRVALLETDLTKKNCSMIINDITKTDDGDYKLRLSGTLNSGNISKFTYQTKLKMAVKALTQKPSVLTPPLTEGEPATLTCTAPGICSGTPPNITWTWRGTGDNITELRDNTTTQRREDLTRVTTTHFSTLTFTPSAEHHTTKVTCQVTFKGNITTEETVTLNVTHVKVPKISGSNTVREGDTLNLSCFVDSYPPPPSITWSKNGTIALEQNISGLASLTISNMTREHAGEYVCKAQHLNRTLTASIVVTVMYHPVILNASGCVIQAKVMTCVCVSQGVPLPLIGWLNTEEYSLTKSVLRSSVNTTIRMHVGNHNNTTVECVSTNEVGRVREKLQVTQKESQGKQGEEVSKDILALPLNPPLIAAFVIGAAFSATICCIILCLTGKCKRQKKRIPKDSKTPFINLEMVACEDQQTDAGQAVGGEQNPLQLELRRGAENGGTQTSGAAGKFDKREEPNEVDYASINYSLLKKKTPEEAEKKTTTAESEYAKIKREKNDGDEDGGEESGMMMMMGKDEENENGKPAAETDEETALYSNVKAIMGGGE
ncbi:sialic acid-binding Ig-like lectin 5 isoform X3 [Oncorhynchus nerka]|uniref:sialic acid-binding Ig-like lectin 5 isoform X3 n=1 Tax=Oncorhynchus nerka TaxID=8023 RepID=UPI0031B89530